MATYYHLHTEVHNTMESDTTQPLAVGEHVDLDTGTVVVRREDEPDWFDVKNGAHAIALSREEIAQIARYADVLEAEQ